MSFSFGSKIGIALAAYQPPLLTFVEQLASIQAQTYPDWFCVISSNSPLSNFIQAPELKAFREDSRFHWIDNPGPAGHLKNFENAIQACLARGAEAISCADQDDIWYPHKLDVCGHYLVETGSLSLVHSDMRAYPAESSGGPTVWAIEKRGVGHVSPADLLVRNVVAGCGMLMDSELVRRFPAIPSEAVFHDHWYALVASTLGGVHAIHEPLFDYRQHAENVVGVTPYRGFTRLPEGTHAGQVTKLCREKWLGSHRLAKASLREGLKLGSRDKAAFISYGDLGALLMAQAAKHLVNDPALSRACLARATGKVLSLAHPNA